MKVYTIKEVIVEYELTGAYLRSEIKKGKLIAAYFGRRAGYRIDEPDLQAWLDAKKKISGRRIPK